MKELSIEEKAKAYDEAIEIAKKIHKYSSNISEIKRMEQIFPELRESEDERIRKEIITLIQSCDKGCYTTISLSRIKEYTAWLEKQGEIDKTSYDIAEKEKYDFVSGQFIECRKSFNEFKEDNSYWFEYIGNDTYIGRSDNILNKKFHITPRQLFTLFTQQHCPFKEDSNVNEETNAPTEYGKYVDECLNEASKHFFSEGEDKYSVADLFYAGVRCGKSWLEKQGEQKPAVEMKTPEESLGIDSDTYNKIVDECIYGEQKPVDKVEPKFKVGDWVVYYRNDSSREVLQVYDIRDGRYYFNDNIHFSWSVKECDEKSHLWTIQDAKDGDVLAFKNNIGGIIICKSPTDYDTRSYCRLVSDNLINKEESGWDSTLFVPATKEQRDLLFQKMKEAGYEWDADKKELKKISQRMISAEAKEAMYAKTAWSEDDEKMLVDAYVMLDWYKGNNWWTARRIKDWLETLKQRIGG